MQKGELWLVFHIRAIDKQRLKLKIGNLEKSLLIKVNQQLKKLLALPMNHFIADCRKNMNYMSRVCYTIKRHSKFSSVRAAFLVLALALSISTLAPGAAWGQPPSSNDTPPSTSDKQPPSNEQILTIQAGRFGLNAVAKLLGLATNCKEEVEQQTGVFVEICEAPDLREVVLKLIQVALGFTSLIALIFMLYGGFMWVTAGGNPERVKKGRDILIWAGIGIVAVMFAWGIVTYIIYTSSRVVA